MPAKKTTKTAKPPAKVSPKKKVEIAKTPVRNTPLPKVTAKKSATSPTITQDMIARRAYEIHVGGHGGSEHDNWYRAERELRGAL